MATNTWDNVVTRPGVCCACEKPLAEQEIYFATLIESPEGFFRRDYCEPCWKEDFGREAFSFWQARIPAKEEKPKLFVDKEILRQIFTRLAHSDDESKQPFTFVLTLILMRKRLVKYLSTEHRDEKELWVVKLSGSDRDQEYRIVNPHLTEDQLEHIRDQLSEVLACD